jgi:hypothetical protein
MLHGKVARWVAAARRLNRLSHETRYLFVDRIRADLDDHAALYHASGAAGNEAIVGLPVAARSISLQLKGRQVRLLVVACRSSPQPRESHSGVTIRLARKHRQHAIFVIQAPRTRELMR